MNPARNTERMLWRWEQRMYEPLYQPPDTSICGQIAVAIVTGHPLLDVLRVHGKESATNARDLLFLLAHFGYQATAGWGFPSALCIGRMKFPLQNTGHWVVFRDGLVFDAAPRGNWESWNHSQVTRWIHIEPPQSPIEPRTDVPLPEASAERIVETL